MKKQLTFSVFAAIIPLSILREWSTPAKCPSPEVTRTTPLLAKKLN
jgi:hypothetical protein